jgi:hypothetical protein
MRVICIENSIVIDKERPDFGSVSAHKGSVYNVIGSVEGEVLREKDGLNYAPGPWYEFLELKGLHHHVRFLEIPDDLNEVTHFMGDRVYDSDPTHP